MLGYKKLLYSKLTENFQDGCDTIVAGCTTYGATPVSNSPSDIVNAIKKIYTDRYNTGKNSVSSNYNIEIDIKYGVYSGSGIGTAYYYRVIFHVTNGTCTIEKDANYFNTSKGFYKKVREQMGSTSIEIFLISITKV